MNLVRSMAPVAVWLCLGLLPASSQGLLADSDRMQVMTDTPEFCWHLVNKVAAAQRDPHDVPPDVRMLAREGQRMCDHGLIKAGILRLRRALMLLRDGQ